MLLFAIDAAAHPPDDTREPSPRSCDDMETLDDTTCRRRPGGVMATDRAWACFQAMG